MSSSQSNIPGNVSHNYDIKIKIPQPYKYNTNYQLLKYEWIIFTTLSILLLSTLDKQFVNLRIVVYSILFLLLQTIRNTSKILEIQDPLQLNPIRKFIKQISIIIQINMTYLLFRILIHYHNIYSFLLFLHFTFIGMMNFDKNKKNYQIQSQNYHISKIITPFSLFIFSIIIHQNISEISIIQLIILGFNLVLTLQIKSLLINKQCFTFGWEKHGFQGKNHLIFNKYQAIKKIMFSICGAVAVQNLLFIVPSMNQYVSFTMFYSLILGGYIFYIYKKNNKK